jgi:hypothetical protein
LAVVDKIKEVEVSSEESLPDEIEQYEVSEVELPLPVLPEAQRPNLIEVVDLEGLEDEDEDCIDPHLPMETSEQIRKTIHVVELL